MEPSTPWLISKTDPKFRSQHSMIGPDGDVSMIGGMNPEVTGSNPASLYTKTAKATNHQAISTAT